jgi:hypothetical protein
VSTGLAGAVVAVVVVDGESTSAWLRRGGRKERNGKEVPRYLVTEETDQ